MKGNIQ